ncbi:MAG: bactofilin family protein [Aeromonas sp.]
MFGRKNAPTPSNATVIAQGTQFKGELHVRGDLHIYGELSGNISLVDGVLYVQQGGRVEGEIDAPTVIINGFVEGSCSAKEVEVLENGVLQGTFKGGCISIRKGGNFIGHSQPSASESKKLAPASQDGKAHAKKADTSSDDKALAMNAKPVKA